MKKFSFKVIKSKLSKIDSLGHIIELDNEETSHLKGGGCSMRSYEQWWCGSRNNR